MSTDILFNMNVVWMPDSNGTPHFLVSEEWGSNNCRSSNGNIARRWSARYFGTFQEILARGCDYSSCWYGASSQVSSGVNGYRVSSSSAYLARLEEAMRGAHRTSVLSVDPKRSLYESEARSATHAAFQKRVGLVDGPPAFDTWRVEKPSQVDHLVAICKEIRDIAPWMEVLFDARQYAGDVIEKANLPELRAIKMGLPSVYLTHAKSWESPLKLVISHEGKPRLGDAYKLYEAVEEIAKQVALAGGSPRSVFLAFSKALKTPPLADPHITFVVTEECLWYEPVKALGYTPGQKVTARISALGELTRYLRAIDKGDFVVDFGQALLEAA